MIKKIILFIFLLGPCFIVYSQEKSMPVQIIDGKAYYIHHVKKSESLYGISKMYNTDMESILNANPEVKEKGVKAGQKLLIPVKSENNKQVEKRDTLHFKYHKVQKGQTIYSLCKEYKITQEQFYEYNPDKKSGIKENDWVIVGKKEMVFNTRDTTSNIVKDIKKEELRIPHFEKKKEYTVLLLLPFENNRAEEIQIEEIIKNEQSFPALSSMMIDFYMGLKYAADSLKSDSFSVNILPVDITETDSLKLVQITKAQEYKTADIIIGPVFSTLIKTEQYTVTDKKFHIIPFVGQNKFLFNHPEYSKTTPSLYTDIQVLARYVYDSLRKKSTVVLLHSGSNGDKEYYKEFKRYYNDLVAQHNGKDTIRTFRSISDFKKFVREKETYTVVFLSNNQIIATDYITQLSIINKTSPIYLCGFYKTISFDNLDLEYLNQMNFTFSYYQNINYVDLYKKYVNAYKNEFQTYPSLFFYEGIQIGLYYFNLIKSNGLSALYSLSDYKYIDSNSFMRFNFYSPDETTGYQNNGEFIFKITDRKVVFIR